MRCLFVCLMLSLSCLAIGTAGAQVYQYDTVGRLQAANYPDGSSIRYEYDANSNITRIRFASAPAALPPEGAIDAPADDVAIQTGGSVTFEGSGTDPDGAVPLAYLWDFDGAAADSTDEDPGAVSFNTAGSYTVELTVTDATGLSDPTPATVLVTVTDPSPPPPPSPPSGGSGGGGAVFWLLLMLVVARFRRPLILVSLLLAGTASAQSWTPMNSGTDQNLNDVWMASSTLAYAVGDAGTVLRYDGNTWQPVDTGAVTGLNAVWGTGPDDIYIVGNNGTVLHYDGASWSPVDIGAGTLPLLDVWAAGPGEIVYIVGGRGAWRLEGGSWLRIEIDSFFDGVTEDPELSMTAIRDSGSNVVTTSNRAFAARGGLLVDFVQVDNTQNNDLVVFDANNMIAVGEQPRRLVNGDPATFGDWDIIQTNVEAQSVWGTAHDNVWAAGGLGSFARISYYDGNPAGDWAPEVTISFRRFNGIHGDSDGNVVAVGSVGLIYGLFAPPPVPTSANTPFAGLSEGNVNTYNGELVYETTDLSLDTRMPMEFRRYYASNLRAQQTVGDRLSENWTHNYEWRLDENVGDAGNQFRVTDYRGREYLFDASGTSFTRVSPGWANVGLANVAGVYVFFDRDSGLRYGFSSGRLDWIEDRNGNRHSLAYNSGFLASVNDGASGQISFSYTPTGELERASLVKSTTLETVFAYENGVLVSATSPSGVVTRYNYEDGRRLTSIEVGSGTADAVTPRSWEYDGEERVSASVLTNAGRFEYVYGGDQTTIVQPDGSQRTHAHDSDGRLTSVTTPLGAITSFVYDSEGHRTGITDPLNRTTTWTYDTLSGLVASITEPGGFQTSFGYLVDPVADAADFYDLDVVTLPNDATIEYGFDGRGNNELLIDELGNVWLFDYDAAGDLIRSENPEGGVTTYNYFVDGLVRSITDPRGSERLFSYDPFLRPEIDSFGSRSTEYSYSTRFAPDQIRDRSGTVVDFSYNEAGYMRRIDRSDGYFEEYGYDGAGRLVSVNVAGVSIWTFGYDSFGRLASVTDPGLRSNSYAYDADGRIREFRDFDGRLWLFDFAADGQLASIVRPGGERIDYEYGDPRGLLSAVVNDVERFGFNYGTLGRLASITDPRERINTIERNARGDLRRIVEPSSGEERLFENDAFGNLIRYTNPLGGVRELDFGDDGLLDSATDPLGNLTQFARDTENRIESVDYADGLNVSVQYAGSGLPARVQGSDGTDVAIDSTPQGRIVGGTDLEIARTLTGKVAASNGMQIEYNGDDRVRRVTFADGRYVDYEYNGRGDVVLVRDWLGAETAIVSTDVGKVDTLTYPNGIVTDYSYDRATRISRITMGSLGAITVNRDALGRIDSVDSSLPRPTDMPNEDRNFAYNLASQIEGGSYDARGNQLQQGQNSRSFDALNRLTSTANGADSVVVGYDALGGVTRIAAGNGDRLYVQNYALGKPRISIERDSGGNDLWYYVHTTDGRLLYRISPAGTRQFYHFDENGSTVLMTGDGGAVIQSYFIAPHGEVLDQSGGIDNPKVSYAELGGIDLGDSGTMKMGQVYFDLRAGHALTRRSPLDLEYATSPLPDGQYGQSLAPGRPLTDVFGAELDDRCRGIQPAETRYGDPLLTDILDGFSLLENGSGCPLQDSRPAVDSPSDIYFTLLAYEARRSSDSDNVKDTIAELLRSAIDDLDADWPTELVFDAFLTFDETERKPTRNVPDIPGKNRCDESGSPNRCARQVSDFLPAGAEFQFGEQKTESVERILKEVGGGTYTGV